MSASELAAEQLRQQQVVEEYAAFERAKAQGSPVELAGRRSETETVLVNPDGSVTLRQTVRPTRFRGGNGAWRDIDLSLVGQPDGRQASTASPTAVSLPGQAAGSATVGTPAGVFAVRHPQAVARQVAVDPARRTATFADAVGRADLVQEPQDGGFKESLTIPTLADVPAGGAYETEIDVPTGVSARVTAGTVEFVRAGKVVATFGSGSAFDSKNNAGGLEGRTPVVLRVLSQVPGKIRVSVGVDAKWLAAPERVWPVVIDPTFSTFTDDYSGYDTYIDQNAPATSQGTNPTFYVGKQPGTNTSARGLLLFNTANYANPERVVTSATLKFRNSLSYNCTSGVVAVYGLTSAFSNNTTWNTQPTFTTTHSGTAMVASGAAGCPAAFASINITALAKSWLNGSRVNHGLMLVSDETLTTGLNRAFDSGNSATREFVPTLEWTYDTTLAKPTNVIVSPGDQTASVRWSYTKRPQDTVTGFRIYADPVIGTATRFVDINDPNARGGIIGLATNTYTADSPPQIPLTYSLTTLLNGTEYKIRVMPLTTPAGVGEPSDPPALVTPSSGLSEAPGVPISPAPTDLEPPADPEFPPAGTTELLSVLDESGRGPAGQADQEIEAPRLLGLEDWQSYASALTGPQAFAAVNVANGNVVAQTLDGTSIQGHGRQSYTTRRTYNSLAPAQSGVLGALSKPNGPSGIGAGWQLSTGEQAGDFTGLGAAAESLLNDGSLALQTAGKIKLVDRDGTQHTFTPRGSALSLSIASSLLGLGSSVIGNTFTPVSGTAVCLDTGYTAPPGVHLGLYRAVRVTGSNCDARAQGATGQLLGYVSVRPDRTRTEYALNGKVLSSTDAAGVMMRYVYEQNVTIPTIGDLRAVENVAYTLLDAPPLVGPIIDDLASAAVGSVVPNGRLVRVHEARPGCTGTNDAFSTPPTLEPACRATTLQYLDASPTYPGGADVKLTDPAGRTTTYRLGAAQNRTVSGESLLGQRQLREVSNPDNSVLRYTYQGVPINADGSGPDASCAGALAQLCTISDGAGHLTKITYRDDDPVSLRRAQTLTDRRNMEQVLSYGISLTTVTAGPLNPAPEARLRYSQYANIDKAGRAGRIVKSDNTGAAGAKNYHADVTLGWDKNATGAFCTQPAAIADNNMCRTRVANLGPIGATERTQAQETQQVFNEQGQVLITRRATAAAGTDTAAFDVTTNAYVSQYVGPDGANTYTDVIEGNGAVSSVGTRTGRPALLGVGDQTLFVVSDLSASLTARGNAPENAATRASYQTTYTLDNDPTLPIAVTPAGGACVTGSTHNTGLVCRVSTPAIDDPDGAGLQTGSVSATTYQYDQFGQRVLMRTPELNQLDDENGTDPTPAYTYEYFADYTADPDGAGPLVATGERDLAAGTVGPGSTSDGISAGGWLRSVTDPAGKFVAYGYDRAGNVARTWDRNATNGKAPGVFPGTAGTSPDEQYSETLMRATSGGRVVDNGERTAALASPWRYARSQRDPLGNRTVADVDLNGNPLRVSTARGTQLNWTIEAQTITVTGSPTGGNFTLAFRGLSTVPLAHNASAATIAAALTELPTVGTGNLTVSGTGPFTVGFAGVLRGRNVDQISATSALSGGTNPAVGITTTAQGGPSTYDTATTYDAGDLPVSMRRPADPADTTSTFNVFGEPDQTVDARGILTGFNYDALGRQVAVVTSRGTHVASTDVRNGSPRGCDNNTTTSGLRDIRFGAGIAVCTTETRYDSAGGTIATRDANKQVVRYRLDGKGRPVAQTQRRSASSRISSAILYNRDDQPIVLCAPNGLRQDNVDAAQAECASGNRYATERSYNLGGLGAATTTYRNPDGDDAGAHITGLRYDRNGNQTATVDARSKTTTMDFDQLDRMTSLTKPRNGALTFTSIFGYDAVGNRTFATTPVSTTAYSYDPLNRLLDTVEGASSNTAAAAGLADGGTNTRTRKVYDADGNLAGMFSPRAFSASVTTPSADFLIRVDLDPNSRPVATYRPRYTASLTDPTNGGAGSEQNQQCPTTVSGYVPAPISVQGQPDLLPAYPAGTGLCISRTSYDAVGQPIAQTMPNAGGAPTASTTRKASMSWTDDGLMASRTSPNPAGTGLAETRTRYDGIGRPIAQVRLGDGTGKVTDELTLTSYTPDGLTAQVTAPGHTPVGKASVEHTSTWTYDANANMTVATNALGHTALSTYSADNLLLSTTTPDGAATSPQNRLRTDYSYDWAGNVDKVWSPEQSKVKDANPTNPGLARATEYTYFDDNLLQTTTTPGTGAGRRTVTWAYDGGGRKSSQVFALSGATSRTQSFTYYSNNALKTEAGHDGATQTYDYDPDGNLTNAVSTTAPGLGFRVTASYYADGLLRESLDGDGTYGPAELTDYAYDALSQITRRKQGSSGAQSLSTYSYGDAGQITSSASSTVSDAGIPWTWTFDRLGRPATSAAPNGTASTFTFNPDNSLANKTTTKGAATVAKWTYDYDNLGRQLRSDHSGLQPDGSQKPLRVTHAYDPQGRLTQTVDDQGTHTSAYDRNSNRTGLTNSDPDVKTITSTFNPDDSIATSNATYPLNRPAPDGNPKPYSYDVSGNLSADDCYTYGYDGYDRQSSVTITSACNNNPAAASTATQYDSLGRARLRSTSSKMTSAQLYPNGVVTGSTTSVTNPVTIQHFDGLSSSLTTTLQSPASTQPNSSTRYSLDATGNISAAGEMDDVTSGNYRTRYLDTDGHGNITSLTNSPFSGEPFVNCAAQYTAEGKSRGPGTTGRATNGSDTNYNNTAGTASGTPATISTGIEGGLQVNPCASSNRNDKPSTRNDVFYNGEKRDPGTGTYQLGDRIYDPAKTAFMSHDTYRQNNPREDVALGVDPLTSNRYNYVNGDPINFRDATGHEPRPNHLQSPHACDNGVCSADAQTAGYFGPAQPVPHLSVGTSTGAATGMPSPPGGLMADDDFARFIRAQDEFLLNYGAGELKEPGANSAETYWLARLGRVDIRLSTGDYVAVRELAHYPEFRSRAGVAVPDGLTQSLLTAGFSLPSTLKDVAAELGSNLVEAGITRLNKTKFNLALPEGHNDGPANVSLYYAYDKTGKVDIFDYVGITKDVARRQRQHGVTLQKFAYLPGLTRQQARSVEEALIARTMALPYRYSNGRHEIATDNDHYGARVAWGESQLVENGY